MVWVPGPHLQPLTSRNVIILLLESTTTRKRSSLWVRASSTVMPSAIKSTEISPAKSPRWLLLKFVPGWPPCCVGDNPACEALCKQQDYPAVGQLGLSSFLLTLSASITTKDLLSRVDELNRRDDVDGILVQMPLPPQVDAKENPRCGRSGRKMWTAFTPSTSEACGRPAESGGLHARGRDGNASSQQDSARWRECCRDGPQRHRWQADGAPAAPGKRYGDNLPFEDTGTQGNRPPSRRGCRGPGSCGDGHAGPYCPGAVVIDVGHVITDRAEAERHLREFSGEAAILPCKGLRTCRRRSPRRRPHRGRIHAGPGRRRAAHDRHAHEQHREGCAHAPRLTRSDCRGRSNLMLRVRLHRRNRLGQIHSGIDVARPRLPCRRGRPAWP